MPTLILRRCVRIVCFLFFMTSGCISSRCNSTYQGIISSTTVLAKIDGRLVTHDCEVDLFPLYFEDKAPTHPNYDVVHIKVLNTRIITDHAFKNKTAAIKVREIYIDNHHVEEISSLAFIGHNYLREIHLSGNDLTNIKDDTFRIPSLEILDLSMNKLTSFGCCILVETPNLKLLNLSLNSLQVFDVLSLISAHNVNLDLSFNALKSLQFEKTAGKIEKLNVSYNLITEIKDCFPVFKVINLSNNKLRSITNVSCFATTEERVYINLGSNLLSDLPTDVFTQMSRLKYLYLDHNNFSFFPTEFFTKLHSLVLLNISHNHMTKFQHGLFERLGSLLSLDVSFNELSDIESSLHSLTNLQELNIEFNQLKHMVSDKFLADLPHLTNFSLNGNDFSCRDLINMFRNFKKRQIEVPFGFSASVENIHGIKCHENDIPIKESNDSNNSLEEFDRGSAYKFNESEFFKYFDNNFKNTTFYKYFEQLKAQQIPTRDHNKSFLDFSNKDLIQSRSFLSYEQLFSILNLVFFAISILLSGSILILIFKMYAVFPRCFYKHEQVELIGN